jgi:hypothetical protein
MKRRWLGPARGYEVASDSVYRNKNRRSAHQRPSAHSCTGVGALGLLSAGVHSQMAARYSPAMDRWRPSRRVVTSPRLPAPAQQVASTWNSAQPGLVCRRPTCSRQSRSRGLFSICHRADAATHSEPAPRRGAPARRSVRTRLRPGLREASSGPHACTLPSASAPLARGIVRSRGRHLHATRGRRRNEARSRSRMQNFEIRQPPAL